METFLRLMLFLGLILLSNCTSTSSSEEEEIIPTQLKKTIIAGKSELLGEAWTQIQVFLHEYGADVVRPSTYALFDENGNFHLEFLMSSPQELEIKYGNRHTFSLFMFPGDSLYLKIPKRFAAIEVTNPERTVELTGNRAILAKEVLVFRSVFRKSFEVNGNASISYVLPQEFVTYRMNLLDSMQQYVQNYIVENKIENPLFKKWAAYHVYYFTAADFVKFGFKRVQGDFLEELKDRIPWIYFDILEDYPLNDEAAFMSLEFRNYLKYYRRFLLAKLEQTETFQTCLNWDSCATIELQFDEIMAKTDSLSQAALLTQLFDNQLERNNLKNIEPLVSRFEDAVPYPFFKQALWKKKTQLYETSEAVLLPEETTLFHDGNLKDSLLTKILERHQGKIICLIFWNTWQAGNFGFYAPTSYDKIAREFTDREVAMVFLAHHSPNVFWQKQVKNLNLSGDNWWLTDDQFEFFQRHFPFQNDTPIQQIVLDQSGQLVNFSKESRQFFNPWTLRRLLDELLSGTPAEKVNYIDLIRRR